MRAIQWLTLFLLSLSCLSAQQNDNNVWIQFVNNPTAENYLICKAQFDKANLLGGESVGSATAGYVYWKQLLDDDTVFYNLLSLVEEGNVLAWDLARLLESTKIGGYPSEDIHASLDHLICSDPPLFLLLVDAHFRNKNGVYNYQEIGRFCRLWPDEYSIKDGSAEDELAKGIKQIDLIVSQLETVTNPDLEKLRDFCIQEYKEQRNRWKAK